MDKKNGAVKEVIRLASRIATLRVEAARLQDEIEACESTLEGMLGGGSNGRKTKKMAVAASDTVVVAAPRRRGAKGRRGAPAKAAEAKSKAPRAKARSKTKGGARSGTIMEAIVVALEARKGEPMTVAGVAEAVGANPASVATMLKRLVERGRINKPALGRYQAA